MKEKIKKNKVSKKSVYLYVENQSSDFLWKIEGNSATKILTSQIKSFKEDDIVLRLSAIDRRLVIAKDTGGKLRDKIAIEIEEMPSYRKVGKNIYWACPYTESSMGAAGVSPFQESIKRFLTYKKITKNCYIYLDLGSYLVGLKVDEDSNIFLISTAEDKDTFEERSTNIANELDIIELNLGDFYQWVISNHQLTYQINKEILGFPIKKVASPLFFASIAVLVLSGSFYFYSLNQLNNSTEKLKNVSSRLSEPIIQKKEFNKKYYEVAQKKSKINLIKIINDASSVWVPDTLASINYGEPTSISSDINSIQGITIDISNSKNPFIGQKEWSKIGLIKEVLSKTPPKGFDKGILLPTQNGGSYEIIFRSK